MIQVIAGLKGSGKTKRLIELANNTAREGTHDVIFLDDDNRYMFDVDHQVRFINAGEYHMVNADAFIGFLCGMLSSNFDVGTVVIDAFLKLVKTNVADCQKVVDTLVELGAKHNVNFVLSLSVAPDDLPDFLKQYVI